MVGFPGINIHAKLITAAKASHAPTPYSSDYYCSKYARNFGFTKTTAPTKPPKSPKARARRTSTTPFHPLQSDSNFNAKHVGLHLRPVLLPSVKTLLVSSSFTWTRCITGQCLSHSGDPYPCGRVRPSLAPNNVHRHLAIVTSILHPEQHQRLSPTEHHSICKLAYECPILRTTAVGTERSAATAANEQWHR